MNVLAFYAHLIVCFSISASMVKVFEHPVGIRILFGLIGVVVLCIAMFVSITGICNGLANGTWR